MWTSPFRAYRVSCSTDTKRSPPQAACTPWCCWGQLSPSARERGGAMDAYVYVKGMTQTSLDELIAAQRTDLDLSDEERAEGSIRNVATVTGEYDGVVF